MPRQLAAAAEAAALRQQQQLEDEQQYQQYQQQQQKGLDQQHQHDTANGDESDVDELFPGEPDKAVRELIDRGDRKNTGTQFKPVELPCCVLHLQMSGQFLVTAQQKSIVADLLAVAFCGKEEG